MIRRSSSQYPLGLEQKILSTGDGLVLQCRDCATASGVEEPCEMVVLARWLLVGPNDPGIAPTAESERDPVEPTVFDRSAHRVTGGDRDRPDASLPLERDLQHRLDV